MTYISLVIEAFGGGQSDLAGFHIYMAGSGCLSQAN